MTPIMKLSVFGIAVVILMMIDVSFCQDPVDPVDPLVDPPVDPSEPPPTDGPCKVGTKKCIDCSTLSMCVKTGNTNTNLNVTCKIQSPTKPYCDTTLNECTNNESLCDITTAKDGACTIPNGYIPDAKSCTRYIYCYTVNGEVHAESKACFQNGKYDASTGVCDRNVPCYDFTATGLCRGKAGQFVVYPTAKSIYALCAYDPNEAAIVLVCPPDYQFDSTSLDCLPTCTQKGRIANAEDCTKFFVCERNGNGYIATPDECPKPLTFNREKGMCDSSKTTCDDSNPPSASQRAFLRLAKFGNLRRKRASNDGEFFPLFENY